ncbi:hypothetical protein HDK64DRAFT_126983 [Phyllosticta capitalensis]
MYVCTTLRCTVRPAYYVYVPFFYFVSLAFASFRIIGQTSKQASKQGGSEGGGQVHIRMGLCSLSTLYPRARPPLLSSSAHCRHWHCLFLSLCALWLCLFLSLHLSPPSALFLSLALFLFP